MTIGLNEALWKLAVGCLPTCYEISFDFSLSCIFFQLCKGLLENHTSFYLESNFIK